MQLPLQITFRNCDRSDVMEARIREQVQKLENHFDRMTSCRVLVEMQHQHRRRGNHYHIRVDVAVPDAELVANRVADEHRSFSGAYTAIREAFDLIRRQLETHNLRETRHIKARAAMSQERPS